MAKARNKNLSSWHAGLFVGLGFIASGLLIIGSLWFAALHSRSEAAPTVGSSLKSNEVKDSDSPVISGIPAHVRVQSTGIDLKIIPGHYYPRTQSWTLSEDSAQWGVMTAQPNNKQGLTFIYAHKREGLFVTLPQVKKGDTVAITTTNGRRFTYVFRESFITKPQDTSIFDYKGKPILVMQTCSGDWDQDRQLFTFDLLEAV